ncbi:hypothetical protein L1987_14644 [Smallanthus sonchifolius]|uniref:Uncharacterized protein n=1 Tax=Smallanthus sonchifolius TaxID=185202 RepID=A0ACB9J3W9_9ASTR|nr:hypothetical protein L1987_14644 [Smallanthus sonchifolius]
MEILQPNLKAKNNNDDKEEEPNDTYHIAYIIHFLLGAGYLVPWNAFITAIDYFQYLYPTKHINKVFSVGYISAAVTVLFTLICWSRSSRIKLPSVRTPDEFGSGFVYFGSDGGAGDGLGVHGDGLADGLVGGSLVGATGVLPGRYMQAVFAGNATAGMVFVV